MQKTKIHEARADKIINGLNCLLIIGVFLIIAYPLYYVLIASISEVGSMKPVPLLPGKLTFDGYRRIFQDQSIWQGYWNSICYTLLGTSINLVLTLTGAYALSRKDLPCRRIINTMLVIAMMVNSGLIPRYLLVSGMNLVDTVWALVLPNAITVFNLFVARTYFETTLPLELLEAAQIDGCTDFRFFLQMALPLSKAIIAVLIIYYGVAHWNSYFDALIYLRSREKAPLQLVLRRILVLNETLASIADGDTLDALQKMMESIKYSIIILASLPMLILYPFMQKYFVQGVMIGAVKG